MPKQLKILVVDDSKDDALLILNKLRQSGYEPTCEIVDTEEDLISATIGKKWDVVLCDYSMPFLTCEQGLSWIKQNNPDIPFILISGFVNEQIAASVLKNGANAYVSKGKLDQLVPTIERELLKAEQKKKHSPK